MTILVEFSNNVNYSWKFQHKEIELFDRDVINQFVPNFKQLMKGGVNVYSDNGGGSSPFWYGEESPLI